jgi:signal peptidase I
MRETKKQDAREAPPRPKKGGAEPIRGFIAEWAVTILILLFGTTTLVQAFVVPTGSMESNILIGDHMLVDKLAYAPAGPVSGKLLPYQSIQRGDIVVFRWPPDPRQNYIKRVIGLPGDRLRLVDKQVYINGRKLHEPYTQYITQYIDPYRDNFPGAPNAMADERAQQMLSENVVGGELVIPPGKYFAMGDNRDNSLDSRYWGFVPRENIIGKPLIIFWSYDAPTEHLADNSLINPDHLIDLAFNFFSKTRWRRTLKLVEGYREP